MKDPHKIVCDHAEWIRRKALYMCRDEDKADELAGETICRCLALGDRFPTKGDFKPYATAVIRNLLCEQRRKITHIAVPLDEYTALSGSADTSSTAIFRSIVRLLRDLRRQSPFIDPVLLYAKGYTYQEISERLGIPVGTVKSRISHGRKIISESLKR